MSQTTCLYYNLILHSADHKILLLPDGDGWSLPHFRETEQHYWQDVAHIPPAIQERYGLHVTMLRCVTIDYDQATDCVTMVYGSVCKPLDENLPSGGRWIGPDDVTPLDITPEEHQQTISSWFDWLDQTPENRPPWFIPGWLGEAVDWIDDRLTDCGRLRTGPTEQIRSWERSALLRTPTDQGNVYFKAAPAVFAHETRLAEALTEWFPDNNPTYLGLDHNRRWMLVDAFTGPELYEAKEIETWETALRTFAQIQISLTDRVDTLASMGCPDRCLETIATDMDTLADDTDALQPAPGRGLSDDQIGPLQALIPSLKDTCEELADYNIPYTLEHGDFHDRQIIKTPDNILYYDWSDASISHPFFCLYLFFTFQEHDPHIPDVPNAQDRLITAYLEPWTRYESMDRLRAAFDAAQKIAPMHHALLYHRIILPGMEMKWEMYFMIPYLLERLLPEAS